MLQSIRLVLPNAIREKGTTMTVNVEFRSLAPTDEALRELEKRFFRYPKALRKEFARMKNLKPATAEEISQLEEEVGELPLDYFDFLMSHNGGRPEPSICKSIDGKKYVVDDLLALSYKLKFGSSITNYMNVYRDRIPGQSLPIGNSPGGDVYLLDLRKDEFGSILYWRHELESNGIGTHYYGNIKKVANSFSDFLNQFTEK